MFGLLFMWWWNLDPFESDSCFRMGKWEIGSRLSFPVLQIVHLNKEVILSIWQRKILSNLEKVNLRIWQEILRMQCVRNRVCKSKEWCSYRSTENLLSHINLNYPVLSFTVHLETITFFMPNHDYTEFKHVYYYYFHGTI